MKTPLFFLFLLLGTGNIFAAVYDTLPAGINTLVAKQINTTKIESRYGADKQSSSLSISQEFKATTLQNISEAINNYFKELQSLSPDAYDQFSLGEFKANGWAEISAQGFGIGHGITDRLTILASVPIYHLKTQVDFTQSKKSNLSAIKSKVGNLPTASASTNFVRELTMQLPETNEQLLQSLIVNYYGYKPLGHFERDAMGDIEVGMIYRLTDFNDKGLALAFGTVLPTGKIDDPDSLQDIPTGDGQTDAYIESLSGFSFFNNTLQFDFKFRYTYQFDSQKNLRMISSSELPLSQEKRLVTEKLGNKMDSTFTLTINPTYWFNINSSLIINQTEATRFNVTESNIKAAMESKTDSLNKWGRIGIGFSGIELYKRKKLDIPFDINLSYQRIVTAKNTPAFERADASIHLYF
jgi:hypothetical protein